MTRTWTPDRKTVNAEGRTVTTVTTKRACNGCGQLLGDVTDAEINRAIAGAPLQDARAECEHCRPLVEMEAAGARTWQITERSFGRVARELDRMQPWVFTKAFTEYDDDGVLQTIGLRVGERPNHVVALYDDWLIRHPDGTFTVHKAPEAVTA